MDEINKDFFKSILISMINRVKEHHTLTFGTEIAYFLLMSLFPFLMIITSIVSAMKIDFSRALLFLIPYLPIEYGNDLKNIGYYINELFNKGNYGIMIISILLTLWAASKGVNSIFNAIDQAYGSDSARGYFKRRILSYFYTVLMGVSVAIFTIIPMITDLILSKFNTELSEDFFLVHIYVSFKWLISIGFLFLVIWTLFYFAPNEKVSLKNVLPGAIFSITGWSIFSMIFSFYIRYISRYKIIYGGLGTVILGMLWIWFLSEILVLGGELNAIIYNKDYCKNRIK